jgi:Mrp family chromosome partitioning ATPase
VTGDSDRSAELKLPTLADAVVLPWDSAISKSKHVYGFDSLDPRSRPFNMMRAKLHDLRQERRWRLFGVVSATPKVGKSFITANVAAALSRDPQFETTAVDLDLRLASLTTLFGIEPEVGIRSYLEDRPNSKIPTGYALAGERLTIWPTVAGPIRSAELLANSRAQALLQGMRTSAPNRLFMIDLPPVFANDDAATVLKRLDAYLVVVEEGRTTQRELRDVIELLGSDQLAGVVLNKYRGGLVSEGYGVDHYYAAGYGTTQTDDNPD